MPMKIDPANLPVIIYSLIGAVIVLFFLVIYLMVRLANLNSRYRQMMTGDETGADFEAMLMGHIAKTDAVARENLDLKADLAKTKNLLSLAITRIGVIRFSAFADMGSDLSFAVALLDQQNDGVVFSSIFGREESRDYAKPIKSGTSSYQLTKEEEAAIRQAQGKK